MINWSCLLSKMVVSWQEKEIVGDLRSRVVERLSRHHAISNLQVIAICPLSGQIKVFGTRQNSGVAIELAGVIAVLRARNPLFSNFTINRRQIAIRSYSSQAGWRDPLSDSLHSTKSTRLLSNTSDNSWNMDRDALPLKYIYLERSVLASCHSSSLSPSL
jgi:hypothetical protein